MNKPRIISLILAAGMTITAISAFAAESSKSNTADVTIKTEINGNGVVAHFDGDEVTTDTYTPESGTGGDIDIGKIIGELGDAIYDAVADEPAASPEVSSEPEATAAAENTSEPKNTASPEKTAVPEETTVPTETPDETAPPKSDAETKNAIDWQSLFDRQSIFGWAFGGSRESVSELQKAIGALIQSINDNAASNTDPESVSENSIKLSRVINEIISEYIDIMSEKVKSSLRDNY